MPPALLMDVLCNMIDRRLADRIHFQISRHRLVEMKCFPVNETDASTGI